MAPNFAEDGCIFMKDNAYILIKMSLKIIPKGLITNKPVLFQILMQQGKFLIQWWPSSAMHTRQ